MDIYKCELCGNIVELLYAGDGTLVCCGQDMTKLEAKTADSATEKHVPVISREGEGYKVTVGSTLHPMTEEHWIQWIELTVDNMVLRQKLNPGDKPEVFFTTKEGKSVSARELCNVHGLWKGEK
jgi:superoxide reductase